MYETVRPKIVMDALKELITSHLYIEEGVSICENWHKDSNETIDFVIDNEDRHYKKIQEKINDDCIIEDDQDQINPGGQETLIVDQNEIIDMKIAPAEGFSIIQTVELRLKLVFVILGVTPLGLLMDDKAECPKIYAGNMRKPTSKISYSKIAKSELMRYFTI